MTPIAGFVPASVSDPACAVAAVNVPFVGEEEIRGDRRTENIKSLQDVFQAAAGIDGPKTSVPGVIVEHGCEGGVAPSVRARSDEGTVEVRTDQFHLRRTYTGLGAGQFFCENPPVFA